MTRVNVRIVGEAVAVGRLLAALESAAEVSGTSFYPPGTLYPNASGGGGTRAYLSVVVPEDVPLLVFGELPPRRRKAPPTRDEEERTAGELKARPGEWACVGSYVSDGSARQTASHIRTGRRACYGPAGAFEAVHRADDASGRWRVYARYVGGGGERS